MKFALALARERAGGSFGLISFVAGTALMAIALTFGPLGAAATLLLNVANAGLSGMGAYLSARRGLQNDLAVAASVLGPGNPITKGESNYGPVALEAAALIFVAGDLVHGLTGLTRNVRAAEPLFVEQPPTFVREAGAPDASAARQVSELPETPLGDAVLPKQAETPTPPPEPLTELPDAAPIEVVVEPHRLPEVPSQAPAQTETLPEAEPIEASLERQRETVNRLTDQRLIEQRAIPFRGSGKPTTKPPLETS